MVSTHAFLLRANSQILTHFQEIRYKVLVKKDIDGDFAGGIGFLKVTKDINICEGIHHKGNHLQKKKKLTTLVQEASFTQGPGVQSVSLERFFPLTTAAAFCTLSQPTFLCNHP